MHLGAWAEPPKYQPTLCWHPSGMQGEDGVATFQLRNMSNNPRDVGRAVSVGAFVIRGEEFVDSVWLDPAHVGDMAAPITKSIRLTVISSSRWATAKPGSHITVELRIVRELNWPEKTIGVSARYHMVKKYSTGPDSPEQGEFSPVDVPSMGTDIPATEEPTYLTGSTPDGSSTLTTTTTVSGVSSGVPAGSAGSADEIGSIPADGMTTAVSTVTGVPTIEDTMTVDPTASSGSTLTSDVSSPTVENAWITFGIAETIIERSVVIGSAVTLVYDSPAPATPTPVFSPPSAGTSFSVSTEMTALSGISETSTTPSAQQTWTNVGAGSDGHGWPSAEFDRDVKNSADGPALETVGASDVFYSGPEIFVNNLAMDNDRFTSNIGSDEWGNGSRTRPFLTIRKALSVAGPGSTIYIDGGSYAETVEITVNRLRLIGVGAMTQIYPPRDTSIIRPTVISAKNVTGLTLADLNVMLGYTGILFDNVDQSTIRGVTVTKNTYVGISLVNGSEHNWVIRCQGVLNGSAISLGVNSNNNRVEQNVVTASTVNGIVIGSCGSNLISQNTIQYSGDGGIMLLYAVDNIVSGNHMLYNRDFGLELTHSSNNTIRNNLVRWTRGAGFYVAASHRNLFVQNELNGLGGVVCYGSSSGNVFTKNNFLLNNFWIYYTDVQNNLVIRNWWGTTDEAVIQAKFTSSTPLFRPYRLGPVDTTAGSDIVAPQPPPDVRADTSVSGALLLRWAAPAIDEEGGRPLSGLSGIRIYRLVDRPDTTQWACPATRVADVPAYQAEWIDAQVAPGHAYYYRLTAFDAHPLVNESFFHGTVSVIFPEDGSAPRISYVTFTNTPEATLAEGSLPILSTVGDLVISQSDVPTLPPDSISIFDSVPSAPFSSTATRVEGTETTALALDTTLTTADPVLAGETVVAGISSNDSTSLTPGKTPTVVFSALGETELTADPSWSKPETIAEEWTDPFSGQPGTLPSSRLAAICHRPPGNPDKSRTIFVSSHAVKSHMAHGDFAGMCTNENVAPSQATGTVTAGKTSLARSPLPEGKERVSLKFELKHEGIRPSLTTLSKKLPPGARLREAKLPGGRVEVIDRPDGSYLEFHDVPLEPTETAQIEIILDMDVPVLSGEQREKAGEVWKEAPWDIVETPSEGFPEPGRLVQGKISDPETRAAITVFDVTKAPPKKIAVLTPDSAGFFELAEIADEVRKIVVRIEKPNSIPEFRRVTLGEEKATHILGLIKPEKISAGKGGDDVLRRADRPADRQEFTRGEGTGRSRIDIPARAVERKFFVVMREPQNLAEIEAAAKARGERLLSATEVLLIDEETGEEIHNGFNKRIRIAFSLAKLQARESAKVSHYNPLNKKLDDVSSAVDPEKGEVAADVEHFSIYASLGVPAAAAAATYTDFSQLLVYPNPYEARYGTDRVFFENVPASARATIYTVGGQIVQEITNDGAGDLNGSARGSAAAAHIGWGLTNRQGRNVAGSVYLFLLRDAAGNVKTGRLAVVR